MYETVLHGINVFCRHIILTSRKIIYFVHYFIFVALGGYLHLASGLGRAEEESQDLFKMHRFGQIRTSIFFVFFTSKNSVNSFRYTVSAFLHAYPSLSPKRYCVFLFPIFCDDEHMQIHSDQCPLIRYCYTERYL